MNSGSPLSPKLLLLTVQRALLALNTSVSRKTLALMSCRVKEAAGDVSHLCGQLLMHTYISGVLARITFRTLETTTVKIAQF